MECLSYKSEIKNTFSSVRDFSFEEKKSPFLNEENVNQFLDAIIDFKSFLKEKTLKIYDINHRIEKLTWFDNLNDECLKLSNDLISSARDLHSSLIRQYVSMNFIRSKGIAKQEVKDFKNSIDELKEVSSDLESALFFLPEMPGFKEITKELSLV
ncbi:hypothetical protein [Polaribacter sp. Hel_I_88]|uniref:hypothetical protein n=1 Tax=Polaribacter sp. Hel_I_88 TaxID=1250006 RepID=UPI00047C20F5|nr:hypothetical protein [Polaribacter sp. Hel_I_88]